MKRVTLLCMALAAALSLSACKKTPKETEPQTTEAPVTETERMTEPPATEPPTTEPPREDSMDKTRSLKGLVVSSGTDTLTIQTERGKQLDFSTAGADIQITGGIQQGGNVTILYKGAINGTDTSGARVLMIVDLAAGETPVTEGEPMTEGAEADPDAGAGTLEGTISELNADRIVILANDGDSYYFSLYETDINLVNGVKEGNYVTVEYNGDIHGPDIVAATSLRDNDPAAGDEAVKAGPTPTGEHSYLNGTIVDCSTASMTIYTDDEQELTIDISDATQCYIYGITAGNYVTIEYTGSLDNGDAKATAVYDYTEDDGAAGENGADAGAAGENGADAGAADEGGADAGDAGENGADAGDADAADAA